MSDQADQLRQLVQEKVQSRPNQGPGLPLVVLSGGTTGVGTTTLTIQLARELAMLGKRSVLVDANLAKPSLAQRMNVSVDSSLADVLNGHRTAAEVLQPVGESIRLIAGRLTPQSPPDMSHAALDRAYTEIRHLQSHADVALVEVGSGMNPWVQHWWQAAEQVFLVSTTEKKSLMDSYTAVKIAARSVAHEKVCLVINRCEDRGLGKRVAERFSSTCQKFLELHVNTTVSAPPFEEQQHAGRLPEYSSTRDVDFRHAVRLLATEVISRSLIISGRVPARHAQKTVAHTLATAHQAAALQERQMEAKAVSKNPRVT